MCLHAGGSLWGEIEQGYGKGRGVAISMDCEPGASHRVLGRNSEESKNSKVEPGLPGLYKDIFVRVRRQTILIYWSLILM